MSIRHIHRQTLAGIFFACSAGPATAIEFDTGLLREGTSVDLRRFEQEATVPEGTYTLDVSLNQQWVGRHTVSLRVQVPGGQAAPCYSEPLLQKFGVDLHRLDGQIREQLAQDGACVGLAESVAAASETLDFGNLQLHLQMPQQVLVRIPSGYLPPENWDSGITAAFIDYRLNLFEQQNLEQGDSTRQAYLGLRSGLNTGQWYWRHEGSWQASAGMPVRYQPLSTSVHRDIPAWSAQLMLGDSYSGSEVFESSAMRGVRLGSDPRMLPEEQRGYAPVVRGVANSIALLSIRQRGVLLHESTVTPGPFEIDSLYASGLNDDLEVSLREADGSVRTFFLPYQAAPLALRPGASRFELASGVFREGRGQPGPGFVQGSWQQGLDNRFSVHGGTWLAEDYLASAMGVAMNTAVGAVGLTGYHAAASLPGNRDVQGQAWRLSWRQRLSETGTDLGATFTRSEGPDYYSFNDYARSLSRARADALRWQAGLTVGQSLGERGARLALSASLRQNWSGLSQNSYSLAYNHRFGRINYGINLSRELRGTREPINTLMFSASIPLGEQRRSSLSTTLDRDSRGQVRSNVRWSGVSGDRGEWGYGLALLHQDGDRADGGFDANVLHRGSSGVITGSLSNRRGYRQATLGAQGAVVAHAGGALAAPPLGESFAIVHAPGADAARIRQQADVKLDRRGYAVIPSLLPYSINTIELDPKGMSRDTELLLAAQSVVPRAGAVSLLHYPTRTGREFTLQGTLDDGSALPFGAQVYDAQDNELGMVGQGGRLHVRSDADEGTLKVKWGDEHCSINYQLHADQRPPTYLCRQ
ncbi:fimbria/pilus outer membrane usher protein [Pseudomonas sp. NPDC089752]|uniref:fimbria/pilus outer membrane usher protein n=1 Tax=Pseudomonas sp. NPDC089752 TaxID=3364472 RepID=UPI00380EA772